MCTCTWQLEGGQFLIQEALFCTCYSAVLTLVVFNNKWAFEDIQLEAQFSSSSLFILFSVLQNQTHLAVLRCYLMLLLMHKALVAHRSNMYASLLNTDISAGLSWIPRCTDYQAHVRPSFRKTKRHSRVSCRMEKHSEECLTCVWWRSSQWGHRASLCYQSVWMICWPCWMDRPLLAESPLSLLFGLG